MNTDLKHALRRFAKSVTVVTTRWNDNRMAMSATAVVELSLDPPSLVLCIGRTASLAEPVRSGARFAINLLGKSHAALPMRCIAPYQGEDRFDLGEWEDWMEVPVLRDAQAVFICRGITVIDHGTHHVVIAGVEAVRAADRVAPLVYVDGAMFNTVPAC